MQTGEIDRRANADLRWNTPASYLNAISEIVKDRPETASFGEMVSRLHQSKENAATGIHHGVNSSGSTDEKGTSAVVATKIKGVTGQDGVLLLQRFKKSADNIVATCEPGESILCDTGEVSSEGTHPTQNEVEMPTTPEQRSLIECQIDAVLGEVLHPAGFVSQPDVPPPTDLKKPSANALDITTSAVPVVTDVKVRLHCEGVDGLHANIKAKRGRKNVSEGTVEEGVPAQKMVSGVASDGLQGEHAQSSAISPAQHQTGTLTATTASAAAPASSNSNGGAIVKEGRSVPISRTEKMSLEVHSKQKAGDLSPIMQGGRRDGDSFAADTKFYPEPYKAAMEMPVHGSDAGNAGSLLLARHAVEGAGDIDRSSPHHVDVSGIANEASVVRVFEKLDASAGGTVHAAPETATPRRLEIGVDDGARGWLKVRAEMMPDGTIHASVGAGSVGVKQALLTALPGMSDFLKENDVKLGSLTVQMVTDTHRGFVQDQQSSESGRNASQTNGEQQQSSQQSPLQTSEHLARSAQMQARGGGSFDDDVGSSEDSSVVRYGTVSVRV